ncbi:MAG: rhomboid family intrarane serine protease [Rhodocyclales bacterium]|nr:rhomboid family intrarane serine protease [Rhodocyclales bacterium]
MEPQKSESGRQEFFASNKSLLRTTRISLGLGFVLGLAMIAFKPGVSMGTLLFTAGFLLVFIAAIDWFMRRQMPADRPLVVFTEEAIESSRLGKKGRIRWCDIESVSLQAGQHAHLRFHLRDSAGQSDKRSFWTGINPAQPTLPLAVFSAAAQEQILDGINARLVHGAQGDRPLTVEASNEIRENRQFHEQLVALAPRASTTYALIIINIVVWLAMVMLGVGLLQANPEKLLLWGGNAASEVQRGEWWRLLTAIFIHGGFLHLFMNMLGLYATGITVERIYGRRSFLLIYFGSGLLGSAMSLHFSAQYSVSVGASGAIFGVAGALLVAVFQHRDKLPKAFSKQTLSGMGFFIVYSLMQGMMHRGIDNAAHVGGLIGGCLLAVTLPERFDMTGFKEALAKRFPIAALLISLMVIGVAVLAPKAELDQARLLADAPLLQEGLRNFDLAAKALQKENADVQAGKLTVRESDDRSRTVHAPVFRKVAADLSKISLRPADPRAPLVKDAIQISSLLAESLEMASVYVDGDPNPHPANPARMQAISLELRRATERMTKYAASITAKP